MSLEQKKARVNQILREIGITAITADNWDECLVNTFLEYNDD